MNQTESNPATGSEALERARRLYGRVLSSWAADLLELRRRGLDVPGRRTGSPWWVPVRGGEGRSVEPERRAA